MRGWAVCACLVVCWAAGSVRAQDADRAFCSMRAAVLDEGLRPVGEVESGRAGQPLVMVRREVVRGGRYLVLVGLAAEPSEVAIGPASIVGEEAPFRAVGRLALDFLAHESGEVSLSFRAPEGTRFQAAVLELLTPRAGRGALGARPAYAAFHAIALRGEVHVYADCEPGVVWRAQAGAIDVRGALTASHAAAVVADGLEALTRCAHVDDTFASGALRFVVGTSGAVQTASAFGPTAFATCVNREVRAWRFPPPRGGGIAVIDVPITFGR